jgi:hypothetical protein
MLDTTYNQLMTDHGQSELQLLKNGLAKSVSTLSLNFSGGDSLESKERE